MPSSDTVNAFLSHSYRAADVNLFFFDLISEFAPIAFRVDRGTFRTSTTRLERMIRDADMFFGVWPLPGDARAQWESEALADASKYFRLELDMASRARVPGLVFFDRRYRSRLQPPRGLHALTYDAQEIRLSAAAPSHRALQVRIEEAWDGLARRLGARVAGSQPVGDSVGLVIPSPKDAEIVRDVLAAHDRPALAVPARADPAAYRALRECDFVVVDIGDPAAQALAAFLYGQFVPVLRILREDAAMSPRLDDLLFADLSVGYRRDIVRWSTEEELRERLAERVTVIDLDAELIGDSADAYAYFSSAAKRKEPVFLSYSGSDAELAKQFADELNRRFALVFDYRSREGIPAGEFWQDHISGRLSSAAIGVILFSESYGKSNHCMEEARHLYGRRVDGEARLLPVRLDDTPAPELLRSLQYRRLREWAGPAELLAAWIAELDA